MLCSFSSRPSGRLQSVSRTDPLASSLRTASASGGPIPEAVCRGIAFRLQSTASGFLGGRVVEAKAEVPPLAAASPAVGMQRGPCWPGRSSHSAQQCVACHVTNRPHPVGHGVDRCEPLEYQLLESSTTASSAAAHSRAYRAVRVSLHKSSSSENMIHLGGLLECASQSRHRC